MEHGGEEREEKKTSTLDFILETIHVGARWPRNALGETVGGGGKEGEGFTDQFPRVLLFPVRFP